MNKLKQWFSGILTILLLIVLFGIIFISLELVIPDKEFFIELVLMATLAIQMRFYGYNWTEYKVDSEPETEELISTYDENVVKQITDTANFEEFVEFLNEENRENYKYNKLKNRTEINLSVKQWYKFWGIFKAKKLIKSDGLNFLNSKHKIKNTLKEYIKNNKYYLKKEYRKMLEKEIGRLRYLKLIRKIDKKVCKIRKITSLDIMTRGESKIIIDVKNRKRQKKMLFQTTSVIISIGLTTLFASIMYKSIMLNGANVFRYVGYLFVVVYTIVSTIASAYRLYKDEIYGHLAKLQYVLDRYKSYKEGKYGKGNSSPNK